MDNFYFESSMLDAIFSPDATKNSLKSDSHLPKNLHYLLQRKPFKNDEKSFLFYLENSLYSSDV